MPSKKRKALSHEQIWDDTALIESWDDALEEYKVGSLHFGQFMQDADNGELTVISQHTRSGRKS